MILQMFLYPHCGSGTALAARALQVVCERSSFQFFWGIVHRYFFPSLSFHAQITAAASRVVSASNLHLSRSHPQRAAGVMALRQPLDYVIPLLRISSGTYSHCWKSGLALLLQFTIGSSFFLKQLSAEKCLYNSFWILLLIKGVML